MLAVLIQKTSKIFTSKDDLEEYSLHVIRVIEHLRSTLSLTDAEAITAHANKQFARETIPEMEKIDEECREGMREFDILEAVSGHEEEVINIQGPAPFLMTGAAKQRLHLMDWLAPHCQFDRNTNALSGAVRVRTIFAREVYNYIATQQDEYEAQYC